MKICYVFSTSEITHGSNKSLIEFLRVIDRNAIQPLALLRRHGTVEKELKELGVEYKIIPYVNSTEKKNKLINLLKKINTIISILLIEVFYKNNQIELVHNNSLPVLVAMDAAYRLNIPYVCHIRENVEEGLGEKFLLPDRHFFVVKHAKAVIAISSFVYSHYLNNMKTDNFLIIPDGFNIDCYIDSEKKILYNKNIKISLYGSFNEQKGQLTAAKTAKKLIEHGFVNFSMHFVGQDDGEYADFVRKYVKENSLKCVSFEGMFLDPQRLKEFRKSDDINIICSHSEGLGRTTIESMLAGNLTIGANSGATPEIVEDGVTGLLFKHNDEEDLADKIIFAAAHVKEMNIITSRARNYAMKNYNIESYVKQIEKVYWS